MQVLKKSPRFLPLLLAVILVTSFGAALPVKAEGLIGQLNSSAEAVEIGKTVTITFNSVPAVTVTAYQVTVSFDTGKFDYVSGSDLTGLNGASSIDNNGSSISVYAYGDTGIANISKLCKLTFKSKAEGSATFSSSDIVINSESPVSTSVSVTVTATGETTAATTATTATTTASQQQTLEFSDGTYTVLAMPASLETPAGFYRTAIAIGGIQMEAFKSQKGDLVLIYLDNESSGSNLYFYDSNFNSVYAYNPFSIPGHEFVLIRPDATASVPAGFTATSLTIDGQLINCWIKAELTGPEDPYSDTYLLYLMDSDGQKGFFLYKPDRQMIFPYVLIVPDETVATSVTQATVDEPAAGLTDASVTQVTGGLSAISGINLWMVASIVLGLLCLMLIVFLTWTYIAYVKPSERASAGGRAAPPKPPKIRRVD